VLPTTTQTGTQTTGPTRESQAARSARTRAALLGAARALFAEKGFTETGREEIAQRAGVTRGALYHHFASKTDVAAAVVAEIEEELVGRVVAAAVEGRSLRDQLRRGCQAYMDACADPTMARILADAPAVLGIETCRALDAAACIPLLRRAFATGERHGIGVPGDPDVAAALVLGFLNEAAGLIAAAPADHALRARVETTVDAFVDRLFA
jgi:AcrR family transcriptional regulator